MKSIALALLALSFAVAGIANSATLTDEEAAQLAITKAGKIGLFTGQIRRLNNKEISIYEENSEVAVSPGRIEVVIGRFPLSNTAFVTCNAVAGHAYKANEDSCEDLGLSEAAARFAETEKKKFDQERQTKYVEFTVLLQKPQSFEKLKEINHYFLTSTGIFKEDPEKLRDQVEAQLKPFYEEEKRKKLALEAEQVKLKAIRDKEAAEIEKQRQQAEEARKLNELKHLATFRKSLAEGDSTSCGLVIEKKAKLVKIQPKSGAEQWVKIEEVFPSSQPCSTEVASAYKVGQMICKSFSGVTLSIPTEYIVVGSRHYQENKGKNDVIGYVESTSGDNLQIRVSAITFVNTEINPSSYTGTDARRGIVLRKSVDSMSVYGGSELKVGQITWDKTSNGWAACN